MVVVFWLLDVGLLIMPLWWCKVAAFLVSDVLFYLVCYVVAWVWSFLVVCLDI